MRDVTDLNTLELPGIPPADQYFTTLVDSAVDSCRRKQSNAERQRKFRKTHAVVKASSQITKTIKALAAEFDLSVADVTHELLRFALCNRNWRQTGFPSLTQKSEND